MKKTFRRWMLACLTAMVAMNGAAGVAQDGLSVAAQQTLAETTLARLLSVPLAAKPQDAGYSAWPPTVTVESSDELNAFATAMPGCVPSIHVTSGLMTRVLLNDPDRTAFVLGHELGHVLLGHTVCRADEGKTAFVANAFSRAMEFAADREGVTLMLAAGYNERRGLGALKALDQIAGYSTFDALAVDHPSTTDRLGALDKEQASLWHAMSAFDLGSSFLATEQYRLAAESFEAVTQQFDDAWEAWNNLGYARLMLYADGLRPDDIAEMQLGQVAAGGYFKTAESLRTKARGRDVTTWKLCIAALKMAAKQKPESALIQENLGLAYTMAPANADVALALPYLQKAIALDGGADASRRLGDEINLSVAYQRMGDAANARTAFEQAAKEAQGVHSGMAAVAYLFQRGVQQAGASSPQELRAGEESLMQFMQTTGADSPWRPVAFAAYQQACAKSSDKAKAASVFATTATYRVVLSMAAGDALVYLGQPLDMVAAKLGTGMRTAVVARSGLDRVSYPAAGMELIVDANTVAAIVESGANAKPVRLQTTVLGSGGAEELRVGMSKVGWSKLLAEQESNEQAFLDTQQPYLFFPALGLALKLSDDGSVQQIVIVQTAASN